MRKPFLALFIMAAVATSALAQTNHTEFGLVTFDNELNNTNASVTATSDGLIFLSQGLGVVPLNQDINLTLLGGPSANNLQPIATLSFANGLAVGDFSFLEVPGVFLDITGTVDVVPGVPGGGTAFLDVEAWTGNAPSYAQALESDALTGNSGIFQNPTGSDTGTPPIAPRDLIGMPSFIVGGPEPGTLALFGLGTASLLLFRRKK